MDTRRPQDYEAIAEELRRARGRILELEDVRPRGWVRYFLAGLAGFVGGAGGAAVVAVALAGPVRDRPSPPPDASVVESIVAPKPTRRTTPCYFIREWEEGAPWTGFNVFKSFSEGDPNFRLKDAENRYLLFNTREQAWNFIKAWNLEACR